MLWLGAHFPGLPMEVFALRAGDSAHGNPSGEQEIPRVVIEDNRVIRCNAAAAAARIALGASLATAYSIVPGLVHHERNHAEEARRLRRLAIRYAHIVLWFEHDLYDQACLVRVLATLAARPTLPRVELVCIDRFPGIARFIGLGQLSPEQLGGLWRRRKPVGRRQLALGARGWMALQHMLDGAEAFGLKSCG